MKILQLISSCGFFGAERVVFELASELKKANHHVTIGAFRNESCQWFDLTKKASEYSLDSHGFDCRGRLDFTTIRAIADYTEDHAIDIVHSHGYKADIYALLSHFRHGRPLVATAHNWINTNIKMSLYALADKVILKRFNSVVTVSKTVEQLLLRSGFKRSQICLIENGVDIEKFHRRNSNNTSEIPLNGKQTVIGTIGRLVKEKGHAYLLDAAPSILAKHKNCRFIFVGDGPLEESLQRQADRNAIGDKVLFLGNRDDIPELLSQMDIFVLPSLVESQPMALLEAMAAQKPIVATDVGDVSMILQNGHSGRVVPAGDSSSIAEGVLSYLHNHDEAVRYGLNAYRHATEQYSSARMAVEYIKIYDRLIQ